VADGSAAAPGPNFATDAANAGAAIRNDDNGNVSPIGTFSNGATIFGAAGTPNDIPDNPLTEQIVFNDPAGTVDSANAPDIAQNGQASADGSYTVETANLTVTKTSKVIYDPINLDACTPASLSCTTDGNPKAIPTAYIQYTITIANAAGAGSANLTTLSDVINATGTSTVFLDPDLLRADIDLGATLSAPSGGDFENGGGDAVRIDTTGTGRNGGAGATTYCLGTGAGCTYSGDPNGSVSIDFAAVAGMAAEGVSPNDYAAGELKGGESVDVVFNVILQP